MSTAEARKILEHPKFTEEHFQALSVLRESEEETRQRIIQLLDGLYGDELLEVEETVKDFYGPDTEDDFRPSA